MTPETQGGGHQCLGLAILAVEYKDTRSHEKCLKEKTQITQHPKPHHFPPRALTIPTVPNSFSPGLSSDV